jgi:hypothetical protein
VFFLGQDDGNHLLNADKALALQLSAFQLFIYGVLRERRRI